MHPEIEMAIMGHSKRGRSVHERYGRISDRELVEAIDQMTFDHGPTEVFVAKRKSRSGRNPEKLVNRCTNWVSE